MSSSGVPLDHPQNTCESRRSLAAALVCLVTVVAFETMSVATIMPRVKTDLGGLGLYGWAFSGLALGEVVGIVAAGAWVDRASPVRPMTFGLMVYALGLVISGSAPTMLILVAGRVLQGFGAGSVPAVTYVCIALGYAEADRPRVFAWMSTAWLVPSLVGPLAASAIAETVGWRWVFFGLVPVVAVVGAVALQPIAALARSTPDRLAAAADTRSSVRVLFIRSSIVVVGTGLTLAALQFRSPGLAAVFAAIGLSAVVVAFGRLAPPGTLRFAPGMPAAIAVRGTLTFAFLGADAFVTLALTEVRGMSLLFAGATLSATAFTWTAGSWTAARLVVRIGARPLVVTGMGCVTCGILLMAVTVSTSIPVAVAPVAWMIGGLGIGLAYAPLAQVVLSGAPEDQLGECTSALQLCDTLGFAFGTGLAGALVALADRQHLALGGSSVEAGLALVWALTAAVGVIGAIGALRIGGLRTEPVQAADAATQVR